MYKLALEHGYCARPQVIVTFLVLIVATTVLHWRTNKNFLPVLKGTFRANKKKVLTKPSPAVGSYKLPKNKPTKRTREIIRALEEENNEQED